MKFEQNIKRSSVLITLEIRNENLGFGEIKIYIKGQTFSVWVFQAKRQNPMYCYLQEWVSHVSTAAV